MLAIISAELVIWEGYGGYAGIILCTMQGIIILARIYSEHKTRVFQKPIITD